MAITKVQAGLIADILDLSAKSVTLPTGYATAQQISDLSSQIAGVQSAIPTVPAALRQLVYAQRTVKSGDTISNTNSKTIFASQYTLPANTAVEGQVYNIKGSGVFNSLLALPGTVTCGLQFMNCNSNAANVAVACNPFALGINVSGVPYSFDIEMVVQSIGANAVFRAYGVLVYQTSLTGAATVINLGPNTITLDSTAPQCLQLFTQFQYANPNISTGLKVFNIYVSQTCNGEQLMILSPIIGGTYNRIRGATKKNDQGVDLLDAQANRIFCWALPMAMATFLTMDFSVHGWGFFYFVGMIAAWWLGITIYGWGEWTDLGHVSGSFWGDFLMLIPRGFLITAFPGLLMVWMTGLQHGYILAASGALMPIAYWLGWSTKSQVINLQTGTEIGEPVLGYFIGFALLLEGLHIVVKAFFLILSLYVVPS